MMIEQSHVSLGSDLGVGYKIWFCVLRNLVGSIVVAVGET